MKYLDQYKKLPLVDYGPLYAGPSQESYARSDEQPRSRIEVSQPFDQRHWKHE